jgi:hypothetical protein
VKHVSEQVWADAVRGLGTAEVNGQFDAHVASGCSECAAAVALWKKVRAIASNEPSLAPPDGIVRIAKLQFASVGEPQKSLRTMARLVFDSLHQPLTAGVRSGASISRQLMFDAEGTVVDLVIDTRQGTVALVGQVVDKRGAKVAPRQVTVISWTETGQPLAETTANEFGEFHLEFSAQQRLRLSIEIAGYMQIRIPPLNLASDLMRPVT